MAELSRQLEQHEVIVDWERFVELADRDRTALVTLSRQLDEAGYFAHDAQPVKEWAFIDLTDYRNIDDFVKQIKRQSSAYYERRKAEKREYYTKFFEGRMYIGDIVAIDTSAPERQGGPMSAGYLRTVEERGGYAKELLPLQVPTQNIVWTRYFGTFRNQPGRVQGNFVVDAELLSYMIVRRIGNFALYGTIIGHADHLHEGIVYKMHLDFVERALNAGSKAGLEADSDHSLKDLRYICYARYFGNAGLQRWKKSNLFRPGLFSFDYARALSD